MHKNVIEVQKLNTSVTVKYLGTLLYFIQVNLISLGRHFWPMVSIKMYNVWSNKKCPSYVFSILPAVLDE